MSSIQFSDEEMVKFLLKKGYEITEVDCWDSHNVYHNDVEYTDHKVEVAYKDLSLIDELTDENRNKVKEFSTERVFIREMRKCLLGL